MQKVDVEAGKTRFNQLLPTEVGPNVEMGGPRPMQEPRVGVEWSSHGAGTGAGAEAMGRRRVKAEVAGATRAGGGAEVPGAVREQRPR